MSIINFEIEEISKICENVIKNSKIIVCNENLVRVNIEQIKGRQVTVCLRFPENYPEQILLIELKSRTLSEKFLEGLTNISETHAKEIVGKPQILSVLKFIGKYLIENPLCIVFDEIFALKNLINGTISELKLKQKSSSVVLIARSGKYNFRLKSEIPKEYPDKCIIWQEYESNLPQVLIRYLNGQAKEIARQCVEPPLRKSKDKKIMDTFRPMPSLFKTLKFITEATQNFCNENCPVCKRPVLPEEPEEMILDDTHPLCVERVYCGHLFHQGCLKKYMQEPPFPPGGKLCPANKKHPRSDEILRSSAYEKYGAGAITPQKPDSNVKQLQKQKSNDECCGIRLAHDRWVINVKVAEARWAQKQARERELEEVIDFLQ